MKTTEATSGRGHLHQIDLFRLLTFACVILVHVLTETTPPESASSHAVQTLLHFTREAFFALTGFVLAHQACKRPLPAGRFWRRRFPLVAVPYIVWTVIYWAVATAPNAQVEPVAEAGTRLASYLLVGTGWYHLYFLLVTLQVYLLFPALMALLRATAGQHKWVLAVSAAAQVAMCWLLVDPPFGPGLGEEAWSHAYASVFAYQFYTVLGAVAAMNYDAVHAWVRRRGFLIAALVVVGIASTELVYASYVGSGVSPLLASNVFQPLMIPCYLVIITGLYAVGASWAARRRPNGTAARIVDYGSDRSFGIFLAHPLLIFALLPAAQPLIDTLGAVLGVAVLYLVTVTGTVALADVLRRVPGSKALTGRDRLRRVPPAPVARDAAGANRETGPHAGRQ